MAILQLEDCKIYGLAISTVLGSLNIGLDRISILGDRDFNQLLEKDILTKPFGKTSGFANY